jgi:enterochelin esterase family protein
MLRSNPLGILFSLTLGLGALGTAACSEGDSPGTEAHSGGTNATNSGGQAAALGGSGTSPAGGGTGGGSIASGGTAAGGAPSNATGGSEPGGSAGAYTESPGTEGNGDFIIGPDYPIDPDVTDRGNPRGNEFYFTMRLADSQIFNGTDPTLNPSKPVRTEREIFVYVPARYRDGDKAPVLIMHDGPWKLEPVRRALDNLTISTDPNRRLPAFVVVSVGPGGDDGKGSQRGLEYDTMSEREARFIYEEILPAVLSNGNIRSNYPNLAFTSNPWGRGVLGCSSGGAAALTMGWFRPDLYRRIISYSGTLLDQQANDAPEEAQYPMGAAEYHSGQKLIENTDPAKPLRIFLHASENEASAKRANDQTAAALAAKGYSYRYTMSLASGHCDERVLDNTLADTLVWMWRGYHE